MWREKNNLLSLSPWQGFIHPQGIDLFAISSHFPILSPHSRCKISTCRLSTTRLKHSSGKKYVNELLRYLYEASEAMPADNYQLNVTSGIVEPPPPNVVGGGGFRKVVFILLSYF